MLVSAGTISDPRPGFFFWFFFFLWLKWNFVWFFLNIVLKIIAYDWKLLRYKDNVPVPGDYVVAKDYLNLIGQAKEIGDDFGRQVSNPIRKKKSFIKSLF